MSAPRPEDVDLVPGRICIDPTDLSLPWPHGGTGLGETEARALDISHEPFGIWSQPWGVAKDYVSQGERWALGFSARTMDEDLLGVAYRDASSGSTTGLRHVRWRPATTRPGQLESSRAVVLLFTPDARRHKRSILFRCAIPTIATGRILYDLSQAREAKQPLVFVAVPHSGSGSPAEWAHYRDLSLSTEADGALAVDIHGEHELSVASDSALQFAGDRTVTMWVKPGTVSSGQETYILAKRGAGGSTREWRIGLSTAVPAKWRAWCLQVGGGHKIINDAGTATTGWHFVALVYNDAAGTMQMSVDGAAFVGHTGTFDADVSTEALRLGDSSVNWHGRIDQVAIWSRAMTIGEIQALYASGAGKAYADLDAGELTDLEAWWDFDESLEDVVGDRVLTPTAAVTYVAGRTS